MNIAVRSIARQAYRNARSVWVLATQKGPGPDGPFKVFVIGSGRSGTHWLGYILDAFPSTHTTVEKAPIFPWVVEMAQNPDREGQLFPLLAQRYRREHAAVLPKHYVDKSHPNLWIAERLAAVFPEARFVAIRRHLEPTVASMLKHSGVRAWVETWDRNPRPNRFLGVSEALMPIYREMGTAARCAVRVVAHAREIDRVAPKLGGRLLIVSYESLHGRTSSEVQRVARFIDSELPPDFPMPKIESLTKWQTQLSDADLHDIRAAATMLKAEDLLEAAKAA